MAAESRVGVAVAGVDHWYLATQALQELSVRDDVTVVGVADRDVERAGALVAPYGVEYVTDDVAALVTDPRVDAVCCFPTVDENPDVCIAAAGAGKHVLSTKPVARTLADADRVVAAVTAAGTAFVPGESRARAAGDSRRLRDWIADGRFGDLLTVTFTNCAGLPQAWPGATGPGWFTDPRRSIGGAWLDHGIYDADLVRWLVGAEVLRTSGICANLKYHDLGVEDYGQAVFELAGGVVVTSEASWTAPAGGSRRTVSIVGSEGALVLDSAMAHALVTGRAWDAADWTAIDPLSMRSSGIDELVGAVRGTGSPAATVGDARANLAMCLDFYEREAYR